MRTSETLEPGALYGGNHNGRSFIECDGCGAITRDRTDPGEPLICSGCKKEMFYRPWCSW